MTRPSLSVSTEIPTSSMADVAFLLIIYFMVAWTFTATRGLDLGLPTQDASRPIETVDSVLVEVHAAGLTVDSRPMPLSGLLSYLRPKLMRRPDKPVIVMTDSDAPYGRMVDVLDELRQGATRLGLEREIAIAVPTYREAEAYWR